MSRPHPSRAALAALGLGVAAGAGGVALVAVPAARGESTSATPAPSASPTAASPGERRAAGPGRDHFGGKGWHGQGHGRGPGAGLGHAIHGEGVVPDGKGGYRTVAIQRGTVTAVSATSIAVRSADGYARTYAVTPQTKVHADRDGIASVKPQDQVLVVADVAGSTATARRILDHDD